MNNSDKRRKEEERKKQLERQRVKQRQKQEQLTQSRSRLWRERRNRRRKHDCSLGMPFIIAFQGDPAQLYYCADLPFSFELIPRTEKYPICSFARLKHYMKHHVTSINEKVLIYKAGRRHWTSRFNLMKTFVLVWLLWIMAMIITVYKTIENMICGSIGGTFVFTLLVFAVVFAGCLTVAYWKFYNSD